MSPVHDQRLNAAVLLEGPTPAVKDALESFKDLARVKGVRVLLCRSSPHRFWLKESLR